MGKRRIHFIICFGILTVLLFSTSFLGFDRKGAVWAEKKGAAIVFAPATEGDGPTGVKVIRKKKSTNSIVTTPTMESDTGENESMDHSETK